MRWWDGASWTDHTQLLGVPADAFATEHALVAAGGGAVRSASNATQNATAAPAGDSPNAWVSNYTEAELDLYTGRNRGTTSRATGSYNTQPIVDLTDGSWRKSSQTKASTRGAWALGALPLMGLAVGILFGLLLVARILPATTPDWLVALAYPITPVLAVLFARSDSAALKERGYADRASMWWGLLPLIYLILRTVKISRQGGRSFGPLALWVITTLAYAGLVVGVTALGVLASLNSPGSPNASAPHAASPAAATRLVQDTIQTDLTAKQQLGWTVDCSAAAIVVAPNASFTCTATNPSPAQTADVAVTFDAAKNLSYVLTVRQ